MYSFIKQFLFKLYFSSKCVFNIFLFISTRIIIRDLFFLCFLGTSISNPLQKQIGKLVEINQQMTSFVDEMEESLLQSITEEKVSELSKITDNTLQEVN